MKKLDNEFYIKYHTLAGYIDILEMIEDRKGEKREELNKSYIIEIKKLIEVLNGYLLSE